MKLTLVSVYSQGKSYSFFASLPASAEGKITVNFQWICDRYQIPRGATVSIG